MWYVQCIGVVISIICFITAIRSRASREQQVSFWYVSTAIAFVSQLFPGLLDGDTLFIIDSARHGIVNDWHAPLLTFLLEWISFTRCERYVIFLVTEGLFWTGLYFILLQTLPMRIAAYLPVFVILFYPPIFSLIGCISKHFILLSCLVYATGITIYLSRIDSETARRSFTTLLLQISTWLAILIGTNTRFESIVLVPLFGMFQYLGSERALSKVVRGAIYGLLSFGLVQLGNMVIDRMITSQRADPEQLIYFQDLAGYSIHMHKLLFPKQLLRPEASLKLLATTYSYKSSDILLGHAVNQFSNPGDLKQLRAIWVQAILYHPAFYIKERAIIYSYLMGLSDYINSSGYAFYDERPPIEIGYAPSPFLLVEGAVYINARDRLIFRPVMGFVFLLFAGLLILAGSRLRNRPEAISTVSVLAAYAVVHAGIFFLVGTGIYFRYMECFLFFSAFTLAIAIGNAFCTPPYFENKSLL